VSANAYAGVKETHAARRIAVSWKQRDDIQRPSIKIEDTVTGRGSNAPLPLPHRSKYLLNINQLIAAVQTFFYLLCSNRQNTAPKRYKSIQIDTFRCGKYPPISPRCFAVSFVSKESNSLPGPSSYAGKSMQMHTHTSRRRLMGANELIGHGYFR